MRAFLLFLLVSVCFLTRLVQAAPPAPSYTIYGTVRDAHGNPLNTLAGEIIVSRPTGEEIVRGPSESQLAPAINYTVHVAMDGGTTPVLYKSNAMFTAQPFTIKVLFNGVLYTPIEMQGANWTAGLPGASVRINLTLGPSSANDGLPDAWKQDLINSDPTGRLRTFADIKPGDDLDGDGLTNLQEFIAGTNPLDRSDALSLSVIEVNNGIAHLEFYAVRGRTYHLTSSSDMVTWSQQPFSTEPTAANQVTSRLEPDGQLLEIYVPVGTTSALFKLYVE